MQLRHCGGSHAWQKCLNQRGLCLICTRRSRIISYPWTTTVAGSGVELTTVCRLLLLTLRRLLVTLGTSSGNMSSRARLFWLGASYFRLVRASVVEPAIFCLFFWMVVSSRNKSLRGWSSSIICFVTQVRGRMNDGVGLGGTPFSKGRSENALQVPL